LTGPDGVLAFGGHTIVDVTTADPADSVQLATALAAAGISYLDAPLSGSSDDIRRGNGVFLVGGARDAFEQCAELFALVAGQALYVGAPGSGSRAKLATNLVLGLNRAALAEGVVFAQALGIDPERFLPIVRQTAAYSRAVDSKGDKLLHRDFTPHSRVSQHRKDLDVISRYAARAGVALPLGSVHRQLLIEAEDAGWGDLDTAAVIQAIEARRGGAEG
jgi:3-hydroxyisobutyrate dehydrogenase-like beta-hydroxyacid dehydrogenase